MLKAAFFSPARAKTATTSLRSFLRYIRYCGRTQHDLAGAVPAVPNWSMTAIPRAMAPDHLRAVLDGCRRDTAIGRRDYAILMLLARLGLRATEIVALALDDIDWDGGSIAVVGKCESACCPSPSVRCWRGGRPASAMGTPRLRKPIIVSARKRADTWAWTPDDDRQDRRCGDLSRRGKNMARRLASITPRICGGHAAAWSDTHRELAQPSSLSVISQDYRDLRQSRLRCSAAIVPALAGWCAMTAIRQMLDDYLALRRDLGYKRYPLAQALLSFVGFLQEAGAEYISR